MHGRSAPQSLLLPPDQADALREGSLRFPSLTLSPRQLADLELLLTGAFSPLSGFLGKTDFESVLSAMHLADGRPWPIPVSLDVSEAFADRLQPGQSLALRDGEGFMLAVLDVDDIFPAAPEAVARAIFAVDDVHAHPGATTFVRETQPYRLGGTVRGLSLPIHCDFNGLRQSPQRVREGIDRHAWPSVLGCLISPFPTCQDKAEILDAAMRLDAGIVLLHPVGDALTGGDRHYWGVRSAAQFAASFPEDRQTVALLPYQPIWAGPRQALLEAVMLQNYGCTHALIDRHHGEPLPESDAAAYYPAGAAQRLVARCADAVGITMEPRQPMAFVATRGHFVPAASVSPGDTVKSFPPRLVRRHLERDHSFPDWYMLPAIEDAMRQVFPPRSRQGLTLFMTGLSGAGKSTLARLLYAAFMEQGTRPVTLLDGDIVRQRLSSELTFSKAHRDLNIERIGYVASEITKNGGIALCAPIAPYAGARAKARELVARYGGFVEIYVSTPLSVCEQRDRKGLYAKARAGCITGVTGIDDPYEPPEDAEIVLDTTSLAPPRAIGIVLEYLRRQGYLT